MELLQFRRLFSSIIFFSFCLCLQGQGIYETEVYDSKQKDPAWQHLQEKRDQINGQLQSLGIQLKVINDREKRLMLNLLYDIRNGIDTLLEQKLNKPAIQNILIRNGMSTDTLRALTARTNKLLKQEEELLEIYTGKRLLEYDIPLYQNEEELQGEISKYNVQGGDKILEVGSASIAFGKELGRRVRDAEIYLNGIDSNKLKAMYCLLDWDDELKDIQLRRDNTYYIVSGTNTSTGVEDRTFDRIIVRNDLHRMEHASDMMESIRRSMDQQTGLFIREQFLEDGVGGGNQLMKREAFENFMAECGLVEENANRWTTPEGEQYWVYEYRLEKK